MARDSQKWVVSLAGRRGVYWKDKYNTASRFIKELPSDCLEEGRLRTPVARPVTNRFSQETTLEAFEESGFALGDRVLHKKFGDGTVLNCEGSGPQARVQVNFDDVGSKWLVLSYAKLTKL